MIRISAWLGVAFGLLLGVLEAVRNWGDWQWWPFWVVDYLAAIMLVVGGLLALRGFAERWLSAGWGFASAMFWMSFFGSYRDLVEAGAHVGAREKTLTLIIGLMFVVALVGLALSLLGRSRRS